NVLVKFYILMLFDIFFLSCHSLTLSCIFNVISNIQGENISISGPDGTFSLRPLRDVTHLYLLAAGTGFTPMARLISLALRETDTISRTKLLFFNKREEDILWRCRLDDLAANEER
ncbi:Cytochrome b5 reductase 4, partial [Goodea atripinnis]